jgi:hypothetical protein
LLLAELAQKLKFLQIAVLGSDSMEPGDLSTYLEVGRKKKIK